MDEGYMSTDEIDNLYNQHTGYLKAIEHYKQLMVGGKYED